MFKRSRPAVEVESPKTPSDDYLRSSSSPGSRTVSPFPTSRQASASSSAATSFDDHLCLDLPDTKMFDTSRRSSSLGFAQSPITTGSMTIGKENSAIDPQLMQELVDAEGAYVDDLGTIVRRVASAWSKNNFPPPILDQMFRATEMVYRATELHYRELREITSSDLGIHPVRRLLVRWVSELEGPYRSFFLAFRHSLDHYPPIANNPALRPILNGIASTRPRLQPAACTLDHFFSLPFARLRAYRRIYLKVVRDIPPTALEHHTLSQAVESLGTLLEFARTQMNKSALDEPVPVTAPVRIEAPADNHWQQQTRRKSSTSAVFSGAEDVERRVSTKRTLDLFSMTAKRCRLQVNPPSLSFRRELRNADSVVAIHTVPLSTRSPVHYRKPIVILLSDLFMICETVAPEEQAQAGDGKEFWLVYPPLAGKHLIVKPVSDTDFDVIIMQKERLTIVTDSRRARDQWLRQFDDCIRFASSRSQNHKDLTVETASASQPTSPTYPPGSVSPMDANFPGLMPGMEALHIGSGSRAYPQGPSYESSMRAQQGPARPLLPHSNFTPPDAGQFYPSAHQSFDTRSVYSEPAPQHLSRNGTLLLPRPPGHYPAADGEPINRARSADPLHPQNLRQAQIAARTFSDDPRRPRAGSLGEVFAGMDRPPGQGRGLPGNMPPTRRGSEERAAMPLPSTPSMFFSPPSETLSTRKSSAAFRPSRTSSIGLPEARTGSSIHSEVARKPKAPSKSVITAQLKCKVFLQQSHSSWKALGWGKLQLYVLSGGSHEFSGGRLGGDDTTKQLVVQGEKTMLISTILLPEGIERVGKLGVAVELSDHGSRTGIVYMLQLKNEKATIGIYEEMLRGTGRAVR